MVDMCACCCPRKLSKKHLTMERGVGEHESYRQNSKDTVCSDRQVSWQLDLRCCKVNLCVRPAHVRLLGAVCISHSLACHTLTIVLTG